jgi:hypothetical protein
VRRWRLLNRWWLTARVHSFAPKSPHARSGDERRLVHRLLPSTRALGVVDW